MTDASASPEYWLWQAGNFRQERDEARAEIAKLRDAFYEIANRAANFMDDDAADWMPSIYKIACEASGEDPWPLLKRNGFSPETLSVSVHGEQPDMKRILGE